MLAISLCFVLYLALLAGVFTAALFRRVRWRWFLVASIPILLLIGVICLSLLTAMLRAGGERRRDPHLE